MANGKILDTQLSASNEASGYPAPLGRLTGPSSWSGVSSDWYQVDFIKHAKVSSIKTQGDNTYYVTNFRLSYSVNGVGFREYVDIRAKV